MTDGNEYYCGATHIQKKQSRQMDLDQGTTVSIPLKPDFTFGVEFGEWIYGIQMMKKTLEKQYFSSHVPGHVFAARMIPFYPMYLYIMTVPTSEFSPSQSWKGDTCQ
jgi:hypothetical protein